MAWDGNARTAERLVAQGITTITVPWNLAGVPWQEWSMYHCNGSVLKQGDPVLGAMLPIWEQTGEVNLRWLRGGLPKRRGSRLSLSRQRDLVQPHRPRDGRGDEGTHRNKVNVVIE